MSKDIKKALEHCAEWKCDNCPNGDDLGSGEIVCRGRLLPQVLEYVADLEAKLAESEEQCRDCKHLNKKIELNIKNKLMAENCELQKQLAEKEKELVGRKKLCDLRYEQLKKSHQDKISFAVEQLEKVRNYIITDEKDMFGANYLMNSGYVLEFIDNQINELKGKK